MPGSPAFAGLYRVFPVFCRLPSGRTGVPQQFAELPLLPAVAAVPLPCGEALLADPSSPGIYSGKQPWETSLEYKARIHKLSVPSGTDALSRS